jgi:hypothetical protein
VKNNEFGTTQSTPIDYTSGTYANNQFDPNMVKTVSQVLGDTGTPEEQKQT